MPRRLSRRQTIALVALAAVIAVITIVVVVSSGSLGPPVPPHAASDIGTDISWPQCSGATARDLPTVVPSFVVVGLNDGSAGTTNPCLTQQLAWARDRQVPVGVYLVPSFPTRAQQLAIPEKKCPTEHALRCRLRLAGAGEVTDGLAVMKDAGLSPSIVWLDVEVRSTDSWRPHPQLNRQVLKGVIARLHKTGHRYGVYSTSTMWNEIVGKLHLDVPNWVPVGQSTETFARSACSATATGGPTWLTQWTSTLDNDLICPVAMTDAHDRAAIEGAQSSTK